MAQLRCMADFSKTVFYAFLGICISILGIDFYIINIPLSGWIVQALLIGVILEYLKPKRILFMVAIIEVFFIISYNGQLALATILSIIPSQFIIPMIIGCYIGLVFAVFAIGCLVNLLLHKTRLIERFPKKI
jgi:hypothetical protein